MILIISAAFPPEPVVAASMTFDLAEALAEKWNVVVITPEPTRPLGFSFKSEEPVSRKYEHIILKSFTYPKSRLPGRLLESYSFGKHAASFIKKERYRIQCCYVNAWPLVAQFMIIRILKSLCIPSVIHIQDIYPECFTQKIPVIGNLITRILLPLDRCTLKSSSKIITISSGMKNHLVTTRKLDEINVEVVHNWQNEEMFIRSKNVSSQKSTNSKFTFMFLGNLSGTAAIHVLMYAFNASRLDKSRLIIAGNGSEKENLISLADSLHESDIEFCDASRKEVPDIQCKADVLLLSLKMGTAKFALPSKLLAYMFSAKPIIACVDEDSDIAQAIKEGTCGWVIPPENAEALANTMRSVILLPQPDLETYGENGLKYAVENFSRIKSLMKLVAIINCLMKS